MVSYPWTYPKPLTLLSESLLTIQIGSTIEEAFNTISGTPQGDGLSPLLFIIYLPALPHPIHEQTYADDINLTYQLDPVDDLNHRMTLATIAFKQLGKLWYRRRLSSCTTSTPGPTLNSTCRSQTTSLQIIDLYYEARTCPVSKTLLEQRWHLLGHVFRCQLRQEAHQRPQERSTTNIPSDSPSPRTPSSRNNHVSSHPPGSAPAQAYCKTSSQNWNPAVEKSSTAERNKQQNSDAPADSTRSSTPLQPLLLDSWWKTPIIARLLITNLKMSKLHRTLISASFLETSQRYRFPGWKESQKKDKMNK